MDTFGLRSNPPETYHATVDKLSNSIAANLAYAKDHFIMCCLNDGYIPEAFTVVSWPMHGEKLSENRTVIILPVGMVPWPILNEHGGCTLDYAIEQGYPVASLFIHIRHEKVERYDKP